MFFYVFFLFFCVFFMFFFYSLEETYIIECLDRSIFDLIGNSIKSGDSVSYSTITEWTMSKTNNLVLTPHNKSTNLVVNCEGYKIEPPVSTSFKNPIYIQDQEKMIPYYANHLANNPHDNYIGYPINANYNQSSPTLLSTHTNNSNQVNLSASANLPAGVDDSEFIVVSIESNSTSSTPNSPLSFPSNSANENTGSHTFRALVRTFQEDHRIVIACDNPRDRLKALQQHPLCVPYRLQKLKEATIVNQLLEFEQAQIETNKYKFGVIYRKKGQVDDDMMFANNEGSNAYQTFLNFLGNLSFLFFTLELISALF